MTAVDHMPIAPCRKQMVRVRRVGSARSTVRNQVEESRKSYRRGRAASISSRPPFPAKLSERQRSVGYLRPSPVVVDGVSPYWTLARTFARRQCEERRSTGSRAGGSAREEQTRGAVSSAQTRPSNRSRGVTTEREIERHLKNVLKFMRRERRRHAIDEASAQPAAAADSARRTSASIIHRDHQRRTARTDRRAARRRRSPFCRLGDRGVNAK